MTRASLRLRHRAPAIPPRLVVAASLVFAAATMLRGIGWITGRVGESVSLVVLTALADPRQWGVVLCAVAGGIFAAYASRIHFIVWLTHGIAAAVYLAMSVAIAQAVVSYGGGWQHLAPALGGLFWHTLVAWLTGPLPPVDEENIDGIK